MKLVIHKMKFAIIEKTLSKIHKTNMYVSNSNNGFIGMTDKVEKAIIFTSLMEAEKFVKQNSLNRKAFQIVVVKQEEQEKK